MTKHWKRALPLLAVAATVNLVSAGLALGKKPPKDPPPDPDPPPITYSITFLGPIGDDATGVAEDLNNSGEVVGYSRSTAGVGQAFLYSASGGMVPLNDLIDPTSGWDLVTARGINDVGQIVGTGYLNGQPRAYRYTPAIGEEWPVVDDLGTLGGNMSEAYAINEDGNVTGHSRDASGTVRAFVWTEEGRMVDIGDLGGGGNTWGKRINSSGQTTGTCYILLDNGATRARAFLYDPVLGMEDLGDFGGDPNSPNSCSGRDINDVGHVVGQSFGAPKTKGWVGYHAFLYTDHMIDLGTLGGWYSDARGVNSSDQVVGVSHENVKDDWNVGFLYIEEFGMLKLEDLIPGFEGAIEPQRINDFGQICGEADGQALLLTPVPPPE